MEFERFVPKNGAAALTGLVDPMRIEAVPSPRYARNGND